jgi:signal transduction histidine kinase
VAFGVVGTASFLVLLNAGAGSVALVLFWVGLPLFALTLGLGHIFGEVYRRLLAWAGHPMGAPVAIHRDPLTGRTDRRVWPLIKSELTSVDRWRELGFGLLSFPVGLIMLQLAVLVWLIGLAELLAFAWVPIVEPLNTEAATTIGQGLLNGDWFQAHHTVGSAALDGVIGLAILALAPLIMEALVWVVAALGKLLLAPTALNLRSQLRQAQTAHTKAASAEAAALKAVERNLHDGPQQVLIRVGMDLTAAERRLAAGDQAGAQELIDQAKGRNSQAIAELRALARGIAPPALAEHGLVSAFTVLAASSPVPVKLSGNVALGERFPGPQETALYFVLSELLANVAKHSGSQGAEVSLDQADGKVILTVHDDGCGGAQVLPGHGLAGLADRLAGVYGTLELTCSPTGGGTTVKAEVPAK